MMRRPLPVLAGLALGLGSCAVGPDFLSPKAPDVDRYTAEPLAPSTTAVVDKTGFAQHFVGEMDIPAQWWTLFHSAPLDALVVEALKANPSIDSARAALRQAEETVKAQEGAFFPTVQAGFTPERDKNAREVSPTLATYVPYFNLYNAQVSVSYTLDIWGANRRQVESLDAAAEYQRFQYEAAYLTLTSNVVTAAIQEASLRGQLAAEQQIIKAENEILALMRKQLELGQIGGADIAAQESAVAQAEATLPPIQKQVAQQRDLLSMLSGHYPSEDPAGQFQLASMTLPLDLPVSLPAKLVRQRPDIRSAEAQLHEATADIGVAVAALLPNLTLSATDGTTATKLGQLFQPGNGFWSLAANLSTTVFDGGTLLHKKWAADAALDQAADQYKLAVLTAFQNVADSLRALQADADAMRTANNAEQAAGASLAFARKQEELGQISYLGVLSAQQVYQSAVLNQVQAAATRFADTAALFQALGGGWWNRPDTSAGDTVQADSGTTAAASP